MYFFRLIRILIVIHRSGLDRMIFENEPAGGLVAFLRLLPVWRTPAEARAVRLRRALESLGPIFVKFGQMLSTRRDLLPLDIADELARLQDRVPPCPPEIALAQVEAAYGKPVSEVFSSFDPVPVASASVAQVHFAHYGGCEVAVKILRPNMQKVIAHDISLLDRLAALFEIVWPDARRLKPREVVAEFARHLYDELDLMREAANCSQLRRNFKDSALLLAPEVYWEACTPTVMVMERMHGVPVSQKDKLIEAGIDLSALSGAGVEIFFTQVFRDGFFHADMHPGNVFVAVDGPHCGKYIALDFGIVGTLTDEDKNYLAQNLLAFFRRDYKRVAETHIEAGWAPPDTRVDEFASAIRTACEPVFDRPLHEISFGRLLLRLFRTSRRFNIEIQPQLIMLQKTLLNIEGLGRELDPDLNLWKTAQPFLERWTREQVGWKTLVQTIRREAPFWSRTLPQIPRLLHRSLSRENAAKPPVTPRGQTALLALIAFLLAALLFSAHF